VGVARHHNHARRRWQNRHQFVDKDEVTEVIDPECGLEAVSRLGLGGPSLHSRVAYQCVQPGDLARLCSADQLGGKGPDRGKGREVQRHGLDLTRHARHAGQLIDGRLCPAFVSTAQDNPPRRPSWRLQDRARAGEAQTGVAPCDQHRSRAGRCVANRWMVHDLAPCFVTALVAG